MTPVFFARMALAARFVAALLVAAASLRFGFAGFQEALESTEPSFASKPRSNSSVERPIVSAAPPSSSSPLEPGGAPAPDGAPVRVTLAVTEAPARSEVYVNGRLVGHSPFLGDVSCKRGSEVRVEVVPAKRAPLVATRPCNGDTIRIP